MGKLVQIGAQKSISSEKKDTKSKGRLVPIDTSSANNPFRRMNSYAESALQMGRESQAETTPSPSLPEREPVTLDTGRTGSFRPAGGGSMQQRPIQIDLSTARRETPPAYDPVERAKIDEAYREQIKQNIVDQQAATRKAIAGTLVQGADDFVTGLSSTARMISDLPLQLVGAAVGQDLTKYNPVGWLDQRLQEGAQRNEAYFAPAFEESGSIGNVLETFGIPTVAAIPQAALAFLTAGSSLGAQGTTAGLQAASTAAQSGLGTSILNGIRTMARQPNYWLSFAQGAGNDYYEAKERGESDLTALAYSTLTNLLNSAVEVGGGIDVLPRQLQSAAQSGKGAVLDWVKSMFDEGREEVIQGAITQLTQNVVLGAENPLYSGTDQNAVLNPSRAGQEFLGGAVAGGLLGAGQALVNSAINRNGGTRSSAGAQESAMPVSQDTRAETAPQATEMPILDAEIQRLFGQQNAAPNTEAADVPLRERVRSSIPALQGMSPVSVLDGTEIPRGGRMIDRLVSFVNSIGNRVNRPGFGDVLFSRGRIKNSMIGHGVGQAKIDTFAAVPDVIRNGQQIDYQKNWKGRNYDTYTFAAPINYKGQETYLGVIVTKDSASNRYYLHEVVDADGNIIFTNNESPVSTSDGTSALAGDLDTVADTGDGAGNSLGTVDTVTDGRASQENSASVEGTRPLNSDSTIPQRADSVNDVMGREAARLFGSAPYEGGRVPQSTMTEGQIDRLAQEWEQGTAGLDAAGNAFRADPAEHIDRRTAESVGSRQVNAFQFDWPELHSYMQQAARDLLTDADVSLQMPQTRRMERTTGGRRYTQNITESQQLRSAMDMGLTRDQIITAAERLIADSGQENYAAAKRLELVLDDMLTNGYRTISGETVGPNQDYIQAKNRIAGAEPRVEAAEELPLGDVPNSVGAAASGFLGDTERGFAQNIRTDLAMEQDIRENFQEDPERYFRLHNRETLEKAQEIFSRGLDEARSTLEQAIGAAQAGRKLAPEMVPLSRMVANELARSGNVYAARKILTDVSVELTEAGQLGQAARIMRDADPATKVSAIEKLVQKINEKLGKKQKITVNDTLMQQYANAETEQEQNAALDQIYQNVADQIPSTLMDKWNAWRYLSMLGNLKTQTRNVGGNFVMGRIRAARTKVQALLEAAVSRATGGNIQRTTSFFRSKDLYQAAKQDFDSFKKEALGEQKYSDSGAAMSSEIQDRRTIFKNNGTWGTLDSSNPIARAARRVTDLGWAALEKYRQATNWAMEQGDVGFSRSAYADALARYLQANGVTAEQFRSGNVDETLLDQARDHAIRESQEATFRDSNAFSDAISSIGFKNPNTWVKRALNTAVQGVLPFRRTPANVAVRAYEYSPAGVLTTIVQGAQRAKGNTEITANDFIDSMSKALTGTGIVALGAYLFSRGLLTAGEDDDENQAALDELTGQQTYALNIPPAISSLFGYPNGMSFTLDWVSPAAMPLFMGAELGKAMEDGGMTLADGLGAIGSMANVLQEMSMLQSINDQLTNISYSENPLVDLALNSLTDYLTQALPTIGGQLERIFEDQRMTTYTEEDSQLSGDAQYEIGSALSRVPGADFQQVPYIDAWGRTEETGDFLERVVTNLFSPGYLSGNNTTVLDEEIQRLYDQTGDSAVIPDRAPKSFTVDGETVNLTAEEYVPFAQERGQLAFETAIAVTQSPAFAELTDQEKVAAIDDAYAYADAVAKEKVSDYEPAKWITAVQEAGIDPAAAILYRTIKGSLEDSGMKAGDVNGEVRRQLMSDDTLTDSQKSAIDKAILSDGLYIPKDTDVDYSDEEAFTISQLSDSGQEHWPEAKRQGYSYEDYARYYPIAAASKKKAEVINDLVAAGLTRQQAYSFYAITN